MIDSKNIEKILTERKELHPDDPRVYEKWNSLTEIFSKNEKETINYLENCPKEQLEWICEVFEDISEQFKSEKFIISLELLDKKYPDLNLGVDIHYAKKWIE